MGYENRFNMENVVHIYMKYTHNMYEDKAHAHTYTNVCACVTPYACTFIQ